MAHVAALTSRIRIGVSVLVLPYRDPIVTAKMIATLDQLARGRIILGVGWLESEFHALGLDFHQRGTGWHPINLSLDDFRDGVTAYREECIAAGRLVGPICYRSNPSAGRPPDQRLPFTGSSAEITQDLADYAQAGLTHILFHLNAATLDTFRSEMRRLITEVAPVSSANSPCPRQAYTNGAQGPIMIRHILIPLNTEPWAEAVLAPALEIAQAAGAQVTLLTVVPTTELALTTAAGVASPAELMVRAQDATEVAASAAAAAIDYLTDLRTRLLQPFADTHAPEIEARVIAGRTVETILRVAAESEVDLIALAIRPRSGLRRLLRSPVGTRMVQRWRRPILLVNL